MVAATGSRLKEYLVEWHAAHGPSAHGPSAHGPLAHGPSAHGQRTAAPADETALEDAHLLHAVPLRDAIGVAPLLRACRSYTDARATALALTMLMGWCPSSSFARNECVRWRNVGPPSTPGAGVESAWRCRLTLRSRRMPRAEPRHFRAITIPANSHEPCAESGSRKARPLNRGPRAEDYEPRAMSRGGDSVVGQAFRHCDPKPEHGGMGSRGTSTRLLPST